MHLKTEIGDRTFIQSIPVKARRWIPLVLGVTRSSPVDPALVLAIIQSESGFDPMARSKAGACGLMQLIPHTGARAALAYLTGRPCSVPNAALFRPELNILLGVAYLEWLWTKRFAKIVPEQLKVFLCVAAYNAGPNRIKRWFTTLEPLERATLVPQPLGLESLIATLTATLPCHETRRFVRAVARYWQYYRNWHDSPQSVPVFPNS